ncbi:DUF389 domain-containing protein [Ekhidna sp. To15]|uniref:DUF389 domain-containing protein n=1 Tax=Ekhidna sp. To15 TaxID=3395267 RepID=UPI003F522C51
MKRADFHLIQSIKNFFKDRFDLNKDRERFSTTIAEMTKGVEFKGTNLWILIFAIFIASIGLNVNSTAIIIGAMLISPLMGPIMGIGLGAGINDFGLIKKAGRNLTVAVVISIATSSLYFLITPLHEAQSELLARTYPTLWDVLIGFFGGMAGIVAGSRKEKSNAIPGVAIATALMPPLCTAGYGLANLNWFYFFGALFLFVINSVFIGVSTFLIVRFLKFPRKKFEDPIVEKRVKFYISFFVLITVIPSIYLAYNLVRKTVFEQNANTFIAREFRFPETQVIGNKVVFTKNEKAVEVTLYGKKLTNELIEKIKMNLESYNLNDAELRVHQGYEENQDFQQKAFEEIGREMKSQLIEDLYRKNEDVLRSKDEKIKLLEDELLKFQKETYPTSDIMAELKVQYPTLENLFIGDAQFFNQTENRLDTACMVVLDFTKPLRRNDTKKIAEWLKIRTKNEQIEIVIR